MSDAPLLSVRDLRVTLPVRDGVAQPVVRGVSFDIEPGRILGLVGESGSGKSTIADAVMGLSPDGFRSSGEITFHDQNLLSFGEVQMRSVRGRRIALVGQDPLESLNPTHRVGRQISEAILVHSSGGKQAARARSLDLMELCGLPEAKRIYDQYPFELSGGMRQRIAIAMAIAAGPELIIADEPTTSLDNTVQAQILQLLSKLSRESGAAILLITHDLGIVREVADDVAVLYCGSIVESGTVSEVLETSHHPYTYELLKARPVVRADPPRRLHLIPGVAPRPADVGSGCAFAPRCALRIDTCETRPDLTARGPGSKHLDRCWRSPVPVQLREALT